MEVSLYSCNAVTASGERIEYRVSGDNTPLSHTFSPQTEEERGGKSVGNWDVILSVDPYERKLTGELDPADDPPDTLTARLLSNSMSSLRMRLTCQPSAPTSSPSEKSARKGNAIKSTPIIFRPA